MEDNMTFTYPQYRQMFYLAIAWRTEEWRWSSHNEVAGAANRGLVDKPPIQIPKKWTEYVDQTLPDNELERIRRSVNRQTPLGDADWMMKVCRKFGLESTIRRRGRPRKDVENWKK